MLAYSGGLDTSIIIPVAEGELQQLRSDLPFRETWVRATELEGLEEKALKTGASKLYIEDLTEEFVAGMHRSPTCRRERCMKDDICWARPLPVLLIAKRISGDCPGRGG